LSLCPEIYIPYDSTVRDALTAVGKKVRDHAYCDYMEAVMSEKPAFERALRDKGLTAESLSADGMSQWLFEMRAHDKRLMLRGGFDLTCTSGAVGKCIRWGGSYGELNGISPWEHCG